MRDPLVGIHHTISTTLVMTRTTKVHMRAALFGDHRWKSGLEGKQGRAGALSVFRSSRRDRKCQITEEAELTEWRQGRYPDWREGKGVLLFPVKRCEAVREE